MLLFFTGLMMLVVAYALLREGLFTAALMLVNVIVAGLLTFNFYEPLAAMLARTFQRTFLRGYEDFLVLVVLFVTFLAVMRAVTNNLSPEMVDFPGMAKQIGAGVFGLLTGYLVSGFLIVAMQTLPWSQTFLDFEPRSKDESPFRSVMPADRVWLAMMHKASAESFSRSDDLVFDRWGAFENNFLRIRRYPDPK